MVTREETAPLLVSQTPHFQPAEAEVSGISMRVHLNALQLASVHPGVHRVVW